jgi:hypothetical protein
VQPSAQRVLERAPEKIKTDKKKKKHHHSKKSKDTKVEVEPAKMVKSSSKKDSTAQINKKLNLKAESPKVKLLEEQAN